MQLQNDFNLARIGGTRPAGAPGPLALAPVPGFEPRAHPQTPGMHIFDLSDEVLYTVLEFLGPREFERLEQVCRRLRGISIAFTSSPRYPKMFVRSACRFLEKKFHEVHSTCNGYVAARAEKCVSRVMGSLSESDLAPEQWGPRPILNFLYPMAVHETAWPDAFFALKWCAMNEFRILWGIAEPREEIMALLRKDTDQRLVALAATRNNAGEWSTTSFIVLALSYGMVDIAPLKSMVLNFLCNCQKSGDLKSLLFALILISRVAARCPSTRVSAAWKGLRLSDILIRKIKGAVPEKDLYLLKALGFILAERSRKIPDRVINEFNCGSDVVEMTVEGLMDRIRGLILGGTIPSEVQVADPRLGGLLARGASSDRRAGR